SRNTPSDVGGISHPRMAVNVAMTLAAPNTALSAAGLAGIIILGGAYGSLAAARSLDRGDIAVGSFIIHQTALQYSRYVTHHIAWAGPGAPDALEQFLAVCDQQGMNGWGILPSGDAEVQFVTQNYAVLAERFALLTMPWDQLEQLNDKAQLYGLAEKLGVGYPRVYWDGAAHQMGPEQIRFPVVIKPASTEKANPLTKAK